MANKTAQLEKRIDDLRGIIDSLQQDIKKRDERIDYLIRQLFGRKSEKLDPNQLKLLLGLNEEPVTEEEREDDPPPNNPGLKRKRRQIKDRLPDDLPVRTEYIDPPEVKIDPENYHCIGEESRTELGMTPPVYFQKKIVRRKYIKKSDRTLPPIIVPARPQLIDNSFASEELLLDIVLKKYTEHLPLYRQAQTLKRRFGIDISYKTMSGWMMSIGNWLQPIVELLKEEIRESGYLQADETCIKYLEPGTGVAQSGYLWAYHAPNIGIVFEWHRGRGAECLDSMLEDYCGDLQCDGYQPYRTYNLSREEKKRYRLYACWAHVRRYFFNARNDSVAAAEILMKIKRLYRIEDELRKQKATHEQRVERRCNESMDILKEIKAALDKERSNHLPQSLTGKAVIYTLNLWEELTAYVDAGHVEIDNNLVENCIRPTAIGKKNWMFFGSPDSGKYSAAIFSLLETCRKLGINQEEYLKDVLTRLPSMKNTEVGLLLPTNWLAERSEKAA
jgi:transposase